MFHSNRWHQLTTGMLDSNLFAVNTKIFYLIQGNSLIFCQRLIRSIWIFPKCSNLNFRCWYCFCRINNNCQEGILKLLIQHLGRNINSRKPASIARVWVIPSYHILQPTSLISMSKQKHTTMTKTNKKRIKAGFWRSRPSTRQADHGNTGIDPDHCALLVLGSWISKIGKGIQQGSINQIIKVLESSWYSYQNPPARGECNEQPWSSN